MHLCASCSESNSVTMSFASWIAIGFPPFFASSSLPFHSLFLPLYTYRRSRKPKTVST